MKKILILLIALLSFGTAAAQDYTMESYSVDSGGATVTSGGDYLLGGAIGQHDTSALAGGDYTISSGFWPEDVSIPLVVALSNASATVQTVFYFSLLLLILAGITARMVWRHA